VTGREAPRDPGWRKRKNGERHDQDGSDCGEKDLIEYRQTSSPEGGVRAVRLQTGREKGRNNNQREHAGLFSFLAKNLTAQNSISVHYSDWRFLLIDSNNAVNKPHPSRRKGRRSSRESLGA